MSLALLSGSTLTSALVVREVPDTRSPLFSELVSLASNGRECPSESRHESASLKPVERPSEPTKALPKHRNGERQRRSRHLQPGTAAATKRWRPGPQRDHRRTSESCRTSQWAATSQPKIAAELVQLRAADLDTSPSVGAAPIQLWPNGQFKHEANFDLQSAEQAQLFNLVDQACLPRARHEAPPPRLDLGIGHLLKSAIVRVLSLAIFDPHRVATIIGFLAVDHATIKLSDSQPWLRCELFF
ncbi:hypothetical protein L1887_53940 [Cichorium endivia]|nr:hypothetical protein L1887_53940 [Cichorium endivia]